MEVAMTTQSAGAAPQSAIPNPYGNYWVRPTEHGLEFQVSVRDPRNNRLLAALIGKSLALALLTYAGFFSFVGVLILFLMLDALLYPCLVQIKLIWIEVRPDGLAITGDIAEAQSKKFFDRRAITQRELDYDAGLTFRYGIHDIATPPFASLREFEIFQVHFEQAIARLWHQENLDL
jgi:hypothetical protein